MRKYVCWILIFTKSEAKSKYTYMKILIVVLMTILLAGVCLESGNSTSGIISSESSIAEMVEEELINADSIYTFVRYTDRRKMLADIKKGVLECGFIFPEDFDRRAEEGNLRDSIEFYSSPLSSKGMLMKETFFRELFKEQSNRLLLKSMKKFGLENNAKDYVIKQNVAYQDAESLLTVKLKYEDVTKDNITEEQHKKTPSLSRGVVGMFLFLCMFFGYSKLFEAQYQSFIEMHSAKEKIYLKWMINVLSGIFPAIAYLLCSTVMKEQDLLTGTMKMVIFLVASSIWIMGTGLLIKSKDTVAVWAITTTLAAGFVCPVVFDFSRWIEPLKFIRFLFPVYYLI